MKSAFFNTKRPNSFRYILIKQQYKKNNTKQKKAEQ